VPISGIRLSDWFHREAHGEQYAARTLHISPYAFAMTVSIACCAAYVTPVSSPVNMLVMEPGGYAFGDYVKVGLPLLLLTMLVTVALVAAIYPL
jgi:di/tricarboxylate transporter